MIRAPRKAVRNPFKRGHRTLPEGWKKGIGILVALCCLWSFLGKTETSSSGLRAAPSTVAKTASDQDLSLTRKSDHNKSHSKPKTTRKKKARAHVDDDDAPQKDTDDDDDSRLDLKGKHRPLQVDWKDRSHQGLKNLMDSHNKNLIDAIDTKEDDDDGPMAAIEQERNGDSGNSEDPKQVIDEDDAPGNTEDFPVLKDTEFLPWIKSYYAKLDFRTEDYDTSSYQKKLTKSVLEESLHLGCDYMVRHQNKAVGNFHYEYDFVEGEYNDDDSPVRQAGALWGMALCFQSNPSQTDYQIAVETGLAFFEEHSVKGPVADSTMVLYPEYENESPSGVNALYGLAIIDYLRTQKAKDSSYSNPQLEDNLAKVVTLLKAMQPSKDSVHFSEAYLVESGEFSTESSSYYDGETLLCLTKAAKYYQQESNPAHDDLVELIETKVPQLAKAYTVDAWQDDTDSDETKGFYQWSSMVFQEYYEARWKDYEAVGDCLMVLAHWIIKEHDILYCKKNTGYAYEGLLSAYQVVEERYSKIGNSQDAKALESLAFVIDKGLYKLTSWQVGGPLARNNDYFEDISPSEDQLALAKGGIMNGEDLPGLRIDTTQHQMHAVMMALAVLYRR